MTARKSGGRLKKTATVLFTGIFLVFSSSCTHQLEVKNLSAYTASAVHTFPKRLTIGIVSSTGDMEVKQLIKNIGEELSTYGAETVFPYSPSSKPVDVIASIIVTPSYAGSAANFWINFPGFLIFAPAWNGYVYKADYNVRVKLENAADHSVLDLMQIPINLNLRHAAMNRTWTEISWFEVGIIALISGIVFIDYDNNVTPLVMEKAGPTLAAYIAQEIVTHINNTGKYSRLPIDHAPGIQVALLPE